MTVTTKGKPPHIGYYLVCDHARVALGCIKQPIRYDWLEPTLLHLCRDLEPAVALTDETEAVRQAKARRDRRQKIQDDLDLIAGEINEILESIGRSTGDRKRALEFKLDQKLGRQAELKAELKQALKSTRTRPNRIKRVVDQQVGVAFLIKRMEELKEFPEELRAVRQRLKTEVARLLDKIEIEPGAHQSKIVMYYRNGFTLHLMVDRKANPTIYYFDHHGVDVDPDFSESVVAQRAERQRRLNRLVANALRRHVLNPDMAL
jgi:ElaB/YqjD/DUF883 family membrane-anchored ribosome-binding protein